MDNLDLKFGYIYVRRNKWFDSLNLCKLGKTKNIPERDSQYMTGECIKGKFELVFQVPIQKMDIIERLLQYEFKDLNIKYDGEIEFYNRKIINLIEPYLSKLNLVYKKLS
jgi:hypothetical protein